MSFPISRSYLEVNALCKLLADQYRLSNVRCQLIKAMVCDTYRVTSGAGRYILRVYRHQQRTLEQIASELDIIAHLDANGMIVAPAIPNANGERILTLDAPEGDRYAVLFRFVEGNELSKAPQTDIVRKLGSALALSHRLFDTLMTPLTRPSIDFEALVTRPLAALEAVSERHDAINALRDAAALLEPRITQLSTESPAYGLVHGDLIPSNVLVTPAGDVALLDFDFCGWGWRAYDIASFLAEIRYWNMGETMDSAFVEGYQAICPLSAEERDAVPLFEVARNVHSFGTPAEHINEWGSVYLSDRLIDNLLRTLQASLSQVETHNE